MNRVPQVTIYARQSGVEISPFDRRSEGRASEGRIVLRFFRLESGRSAIRFVVEPAEAFDLFGRMHRVVSDGGKESLNHRFEGLEGEVQTRLTIERWERNGKTGYALSVQRGEEELNVPVGADRFLYAAEFLRHLSLRQAWVEEPDRGRGQDT